MENNPDIQISAVLAENKFLNDKIKALDSIIKGLELQIKALEEQNNFLSSQIKDIYSQTKEIPIQTKDSSTQTEETSTQIKDSANQNSFYDHYNFLSPHIFAPDNPKKITQPFKYRIIRVLLFFFDNETVTYASLSEFMHRGKTGIYDYLKLLRSTGLIQLKNNNKKLGIFSLSPKGQELKTSFISHTVL